VLCQRIGWNECIRCDLFFLCRVGRGSVVVGNVGDNSVSSYRLRASETQQLAHATPRVELLGAAVSQ